VEAGFSPVEAIKIATLNGAIYLGRDKQIGSIAAGKNADIVVIKGDPSNKISDIERVEIVFKDGIGYDSQKLLDSVKGRIRGVLSSSPLCVRIAGSPTQVQTSVASAE